MNTELNIESIVFVTTLKCSMSCEFCCFSEVTPKNLQISKTYSEHIIKHFLKIADIRRVSFTGGEPTLLKDDLYNLIEFSTKLGLDTRVISNAQWAKNAIDHTILSFKKSGLTELVLTTGNQHNQFLDFNCVLEAAIKAAANGIRCTIKIENKIGCNEDVYIYNNIKNELKKRKITEIELIKFGIYEKESYKYLTKTNECPKAGFICDTFINDLCIMPTGEVLACCGFAAIDIYEFKMGTLDDFLNLSSRKDLLRFLNRHKIFDVIRTYGAQNIWQFYQIKLGVTDFYQDLQQPCSWCNLLFSEKGSIKFLESLCSDPDLKNQLDNYFQENWK